MKRMALVLYPFLVVAESLQLPVVYDPFEGVQHRIKKEHKTRSATKKQKISLVVSAIFNNKAFINKKFYTIGEKIGKYRVVEITSTYVILEGANHKVLLPLLRKKYLK